MRRLTTVVAMVACCRVYYFSLPVVPETWTTVASGLHKYRWFLTHLSDLILFRYCDSENTVCNYPAFIIFGVENCFRETIVNQNQ